MNEILHKNPSVMSMNHFNGFILQNLNMHYFSSPMGLSCRHFPVRIFKIKIPNLDAMTREGEKESKT